MNRGPRDAGSGVQPNGTAAASADTRSVGDLLRELSNEGADLVRQEVALAKAEMHEKVDLVQASLRGMIAGGVVLLAALLPALWAANLGLTALLSEAIGPETAIWVAPLILAGALALIGWSVLSASRARLAEEGIRPEQTAESLKTNKAWAERKVRAVKEEVKHG